MRTADFDQIVEQAFHRIPVRFRRRMHNVAVIVEDEPSPLQLQWGNASYASTLLGLYEGRPLAYRSVWEGFQLPDRITIFQGPHECMARNRKDLARTRTAIRLATRITRMEAPAGIRRRSIPLPTRIIHLRMLPVRARTDPRIHTAI